MAEKLKLALKNPVLPLALRALGAAIAIFWFRMGDFSLLRVALFTLIILFFYLKPLMGATRFFSSSLTLVAIVLLAPQVGGLLGFYLNITLALMGFMLLGVKTLVFTRRQNIYYLTHLLLVLGLASLFSLGIISYVALFAFSFLILREFYSIISPQKPDMLNLIAALGSMLLTQLAWVTSFFPTSFLVSAAFMVLLVFLFHDALVHHFRGVFDKKMAWRLLIIFTVLSTIILSLPVWGFK